MIVFISKYFPNMPSLIGLTVALALITIAMMALSNFMGEFISVSNDECIIGEYDPAINSGSLTCGERKFANGSYVISNFPAMVYLKNPPAKVWCNFMVQEYTDDERVSCKYILPEE